MNRRLLRFGALATGALLLMIVGAQPPALASEPITVQRSEARVAFPTGVSFTLEAAAAAEITEVGLQINVPSQRYGAFPQNVRPDFRPGPRVTASYTWRRLGSALPPGAVVSYRWRLTDAAGATLETPPATVTVEDNRFTWREQRDGLLTVRWYRGDDAFGRRLLDEAIAAAARLSREQGVDMRTPVTVHVYGSTDDLRGAVPGAPAWIGGISIAEHDTLLIPVSPRDPTEGLRALVHELSHQFVYQSTFNSAVGSRVPAWLNEGLATVAEDEQPSAENRRALREAVSADALPTLRVLSTYFSRLQSREATLAYAASASVVRYLFRVGGGGAMRALLAQFSEGRATDDALLAVYGRTQDQIEDDWRRDLGLRPVDRGAADAAPVALPPTAPASATAASDNTVVLLATSAIVVVIVGVLAGTFALVWTRRRT